MKILQAAPVAFKGSLHEVRLIQFSVDAEELRPMLPKELPLHLFRGKPIISMVNVKLKAMHPVRTGKLFTFNYQHVAFRVVVDDAHAHEDGLNRAVYFLQSFNQRPFLRFSSNMLTSFNMHPATINDKDFMFEMESGGRYLHYAIEKQAPEKPDPELKAAIGRLDRAYAKVKDQWYLRQVLRKHWPIEPVNLYHFETSFFKTAKPVGAFIIREPIDYHWLAPKHTTIIGG